MASLEGGIGAVGTASGQAAEFLTMASLAGAGDHLVASAQLYGGTRTLLDVTLRRFGVDTTFVEQPEPDDVAAAITPQTKAIYTEVIANPSGVVADLAGLADVAHAHGIPLVVDSTIATPYLCRPIEHGADIVVHSATKFLGGHGTSIGGVVVESGRFDWDNGRFPLMTEPVAVLRRALVVGQLRRVRLPHPPARRAAPRRRRDADAVQRVPVPQGLETLPCGCASTSTNAVAVAEFLAGHDCVDWVSYAGLPDSPWYDRAQRYLPDGAGAVFAFGVRAGARPAEVHRVVPVGSHLANIGDARTLVIHPASTTHQQLSDEALAGGRRPPDLVRISVGIEDADDICWDLDQALREADPVSVITSARERLAILQRTRTVAIVGMSANPAGRATSSRPTSAEPPTGRSGSSTPARPRSSARRCTPRSPTCPSRPTSSTCSAAPTTCRRSPRRRSRAAPGRCGSSSGCVTTRPPSGRASAGLDVVQDRCLKIEHARFAGGLHLAGFDTGVIDARRERLV